MIRGVALVLLVGLAAGCKEDQAQCSEASPCEGFGETCVRGECVSRSCANSSQCPMEQFCEDGSCAEGCAEDSDCYADSFCAEGKCAASGCRETSLDCDFKEFCDVATGDCYEAAGYYCRECQDDADCGGNGNTCLGFGMYGNYCGVTCETSLDCPATFDCVPISDSSGNIISQQCLTYCWIYITDEEAARVAADTQGQPVPEPTPVESLVCPVEREGAGAIRR